MQTSVMRSPRPSRIVAVLAFAGMGGSFMQTILTPIQAQLPAFLNSTRENTAWVITVTLLASAVFTPIAGKLGDMYGKRRIAVILLGFVVAGSIVCALSTALEPMLVGRALQGLGAGVIPLGIAILRDCVPPERLGTGIALVSATLGVGGAVGLPVSAFVTEHFDWHVLFWVSAAIGLISLLLYVAVIPSDVQRTDGRFDLGGAVGLALALVGVLLGISKGNEWGWTSAPILLALGGGIGILIIWGFGELRHENPLVDLRVSSRGPVLITNLASIAMGFALFASSVVFPQLLELPASTGGLGLGLQEASFVLMPAGLAMLAMSPLAGWASRRFGPKPLLVAGAAVITLSYAAAVALELDVWLVLLINTFIGVGIGLGYAAMPALIMRAVPSHESGAANGLNTLMRSLGTSVAAAVIAAVLASSAMDSLPTAAGFQAALVSGLVASLLCTILAAFIPAARRHAREEPALPTVPTR